MHSDWLGNPVTGGDDAVLQGIDDFSLGFLGYETRMVNLLAVADAHPGHCLANAYAAMLHMFGEAAGVEAAARPYLARAEAAATGVTERERRAVEMARAWVGGDIARVIRLGQEGAEADPRDLTLMKIAQYHAFNRGDAAGMLRLAHAVLPACDEVPYAHGMAAFAYEQCHLMAEAEQAAWRAVRLKRKEPWAHHALAHVMLTGGRIAEGRAFLADVSETWTDLNSFMVTHNWWHQALFLISQGDLDGALALYDTQVWGVWKEYSQDQIGAVSLLARLELVGVDVGDRWTDVGAYLAHRTGDLVNPFLTLQYLYGLDRAGRAEADTLMAALAALAADPASDPVWREVALPAAEGLRAHAAGDWPTCLARLGSVQGRLMEAGGSHAQRDLFDQILLDAMIRAGRDGPAQQMLELRRRHEPDSVPLNRMLAGVYGRLGLPEEAARAQARTRLAT
jgi:Flp pilus assembly pilin Flp